MRVRWTPSAKADLANQFNYLAELNFDAAVVQEDRILSAVARLAEFPEIGRPGPFAGARELVVNKTPYLIVYRITQNEVRILRLVHGAQDWPSELQTT